MRLQVHKNFIFVKLISEVHSKLILPPVFQKRMENAQRGIVKACGPLSYVNEGEIIVFDKWADNAIELNGEKLLIIQPNAVVAVEA